jgi:hypothetical protein
MTVSGGGGEGPSSVQPVFGLTSPRAWRLFLEADK